MKKEDKILYEQLFNYEGISEEEFNYYLNILLHTKEISDARALSDSFDLVFMSITKKDNLVSFSGASSNGIENRYYTGNIVSADRLTVLMDVHRFIEEEDNKDYKTKDVFISYDNTVERESASTIDNIITKEEIKLYDKSMMEEYSLKHVR